MAKTLVAIPILYRQRAVIHVEVDLDGIGDPQAIARNALQDLVRGAMSSDWTPRASDLRHHLNVQDDGEIEVLADRPKPENQVVDFSLEVRANRVRFV